MTLLRRATPLLAGRAISALLTFLIPIVLAHHLLVREYGTYKQLFLVATTAYLIGQVGLTASLYFFLPRAGEERGRYLVQALAGLFLIGGLLAALLYLGAGALARRFSNPDLVPLATPLALYVWGWLGAAPLEISLTSTNRTGWAGLSYVISDLCRTALLTAPILGGLGLGGLAWGAAILTGGRLVAAWTLALSGKLGPPLAPTRAALKAQLRYALPFGGAVLLATLQIQLGQFVVSALTDAATYAIYAVGVLQLPVTDILYTPVAEVMMVRLGEPHANAPAVFREAVARLFVFFLPLSAFLWAAASEFIPTVYTRAYLASVPIFALAVIELPLNSLPVDGLLRALDCTRTIFGWNAARLAFAALAVPAGLVLLGLPGAMLGYIVTQGLAKLMLVRAAARRLKIRARDLVPRPELFSWGLRAAAIYGAVSLLRWKGPWHGLAFLAASATLAFVIWLAAVLSAGELRGHATAEEASLG